MNINGPIEYDKLTRDELIDLIVSLKDEKLLDVYYNVAYGISRLIFGEIDPTSCEKSEN